MDSDIDMNERALALYVDKSADIRDVVQSDKTNISILWQEELKKGEITVESFKEFWRNAVPSIQVLKPTYVGSEDVKMNAALFQYLEEYILGGKAEDVLPTLSKMDKSPSVCGRVFKMGEPTYSCRECGMDPTCVLCVDCFKQSAHRNHKYKMGTSNGGGCCDCGDKEAWKREPFCDIHILGTLVETAKVSGLPPDILDRARKALEAILWYCYDLLSLEHVPSLPADLHPTNRDSDTIDTVGLYESPDTFCTVLYNDETHTFEQVIHTLIRVIQCSQKDAVDYVTNIDREGRAVVKCATFQHCDVLKTEIEHYTTRHASVPLKVLVMHFDVISHQVHALKMLAWLQGFLGQLEGLRLIFSEAALKTGPSGTSIIEGILQRDYYLWKAARTSWHRLFISGMLLEYESKKALATVFTKNYGSVMKDFIKDDHDPSFSISSLSVQIFTVPTLAHYLIAEQDVLFILTNTFMSECKQKCNDDGKFIFARSRQNNQNSQNMMTFKRAQYILYDLRYLLSAKPEKWTSNLRKGFMVGLAQVLKLFCCMQGMDAVVRQVGHHVDYEPEWESAFNLHIKLAHVISLMLEWCSTDIGVLLNAYKCTLRKLLLSMDTVAPVAVNELAGHRAACFVYDIATQPVSIHLPLSRFLAGLHLHLEKFELSFYNERVTGGMKSLTPELLMEPVLRTQALIAQVNAGMWRRNGYSLLNQVYFYHNVKCRAEMLDRDIVLLQMGATLIDSNEFLIHVLHRFNLLNWVNPSFEQKSLTRNPEDDSMRQTINLVEEFLGLLITIIGERHVPGISDCTNDDRIKKEIIQQLCIKPMPHSELNKTLAEDIHHETGLENVIDQIANFKKSQNTGGKGLYELKPEYYDDYNVFFYHYTREELSLSEGAQRSRRKAAGLLECCPPPKLLKLKESFGALTNLLQCDVMLHIMQTVLTRSIDLRARSFSEPQLHKIVHLIGYALQEEESKYYPYFNFTARAEEWKLLQHLQQLINSPRVEVHKDLLTWVINKYKEIAVVPISTEVASTNSDSNSTTALCENDNKAWRRRMAAQKRAKVLAELHSQQTNFMRQNADEYPDFENEFSSQSASELNATDEIASANSNKEPVCLGPNQTSRSFEKQSYKCILCTEDCIVSVDGPALVLSAFVQQSSVLYQHRSLDESVAIREGIFYLGAALGPAPLASTCGHVMHSVCWNNQMKTVSATESRRPYRLRQLVSYDIEKKEFLCPLCQCLTNTVMPLVPPLKTILQPNNHSVVDISFEDWLKCIQYTINVNKPPTELQVFMGINNAINEDGDNPYDKLSTASPHIPTLEVVVNNIEGDIGNAFQNLYPKFNQIKFNTDLCTALKQFTLATTPNKSKQGTNLPSSCFKTCSYTIVSLEILLRESGKSLLGDLSSSQRDCVRGLVRLCGVLQATYYLSNSFASLYLSTILQNTGACILEWDTFGILVPLTFTLPSLFWDIQAAIANGGTQDHHILNLLFLSHIVKILITMDLDNESMEVDNTDIRNTELLKFMIMIKSMCKLSCNTSDISLEDKVKHACLPFLRCCAIFYHFLTDIPAPSSLTQGMGSFDDLCYYLGLESDLEKVVSCDYAQSLARTWCSHENVAMRLLPDMKESLVIQPIAVPQLISLPKDYSELINTVSLFTCPNSDRDDSRNPTMCLVCGLMLCSQSYCCQTELESSNVGACTYHSQTCGAGAGVFLRVRECEVLFLSTQSRGCFVSPPYLDEYGETDQGLRRGNPLTLCAESFRKLHHIWLSHGVHEVISRAIESNTNLATVTTQWQHL